MLFKKLKPVAQAQNELIGKKIADIYGLLCPRYYIHVMDGYHTEVFSEDINILGDFENNLILSAHGTNLYDIGNWLALKGYDTKQIMPDIYKMYIMDMLFGNSDRKPSNWGIIRNDDEQRVIIFDNEMIFSKDYVPFVFADTEDLRNYPNYDADQVIKARVNDIKTFLFTYDYKFVELFKRLLFRLPPERLNIIFDAVEKESGLKVFERERKFNQYQEIYTRSCELLEELDLASGRK